MYVVTVQLKANITLVHSFFEEIALPDQVLMGERQVLNPMLYKQ